MASPTHPSELFKYLVKRNRQQMRPHIRKRTRHPLRTFKQLYPMSIERQYQRFFIRIMGLFSAIAIPRIKANLQRWLNEYKGDSRTDSFSNEYKDLDDTLEDDESDLFDEDGDGFEGENRKSINLALIGFASALILFNGKQFQKATDPLTGGIPFISKEPWEKETVDAWANENFRLIKSLSAEYIKQLNMIVSEGVRAGRPYDAIMKDLLAKDLGLTKYKARFLARDQVGKLNGKLAEKRATEVGMNLYEWDTARDERVRPSHQVLDSKICTYDDDSVYADTVEDAMAGNWSDRSELIDEEKGEPAFEGSPGEDYQCRCVAIPCADEIINNVDEEINEEENNNENI